MRGCLCSLGVALLLAALPVSAAEVVDPAEVAPGSRGVCLTELDGGEIAEVPLTVIGTVGPSAPEGELVLVRLDDPRFADTGIAAGMSGSPVYVDGRLLGALAVGWAFESEPIGGVTPFVRMETIPGPEDAAPAGNGPRPSLAAVVDAARHDALDTLLLDWLLAERRATLPALPLTVAVGGLGPGPSAVWLEEAWRRLGWVAAPAGGADTTAAGNGPLVPGAMVTGVLVDGDATLAVGGTVTEVRGEEVWAFGHPFLGGGRLRLPMARGHVLTLLPSRYMSFKFFTVGETLGALELDRRHGVWGRLGPAPPLVPVTVAAGDRSYAFRSLRHPILLPLLVAYLTQASHAVRGATFGEQTIRLGVEVDYAGIGAATLDETFAGAEAPTQAAALAGAVVAYLEGSPFAPPELERIAITLRPAERLEGAELVDVAPERSVVEPGERLGVRVRLRPRRGAVVARRLEVVAPVSLSEGPLDLIVADGASWSAYDLKMRPPRPATFGDDVALLDRLVPSTDLVVALERPAVGMVLDGGGVAAPAGLVATVRGALGNGLQTTSHRVVARVVEAMPYPLLGAQRLRLRVRVDGGGSTSEGS